MKKKRVILASLALSTALALGMATPAFAADMPRVNKTVEVNPNVHPATTFFQFEAEPIELETNVQGVLTSIDGPDLMIDDIGTFGGGLTPNQGSTEIKFDGPWTHSGIYAWKITEKAAGDDGMEYDPQIYTLIADVKNAAQGGDFDVTYTIVEGQATSIDNLPGDKVISMDFTNKFTRPANDLTIKKEVTNGGDTAQQFEFTITFDVPAVLPAGVTAEQYLNGITPDIAGGATILEDNPANPGDTTRTFKFSAAHNETIAFKNTLEGATWSISEAPVAGYTQKWSYYVDQQEFINEDNIPCQAYDCTMINQYDVTPPTGLFLNSLPFILMGLVAVAGVVAYSAAKKKIVH